MRFLLLPALALLAPALVACGASPAESDPRPSVVASTDVYASVATAIGGDRIRVTSILSGDRDPHEYQASARDLLAVSRADVVIRNGGGYDSFLDPMLQADTDVLDTAALIGFDPESEGIAGNEHLWYALPVMGGVADALAEQLADIDPSGAELYRDNLLAFDSRLAELEGRVAALSEEEDPASGVLVTEPVPLHLLADLGLEDRTPPQFSQAVEEDGDVAPQVLASVLHLVRGGRLAFLAYNPQTATAQTEQVRGAAEAAGLPVVEFTETLPAGLTYLDWMSANIEHVASVLGAD